MLMQKPGYIKDNDGRMDFIIMIRHLCWYSYMLGSRNRVPLNLDVDHYSSQRDGVTFLDMKLNATPEDNHDHWMKYKKMYGWKHGDILDSEKKEHPCMVPFSDLPSFEKYKDELAILSYDIANQLWEQHLKNMPNIFIEKVPVIKHE